MFCQDIEPSFLFAQRWKWWKFNFQLYHNRHNMLCDQTNLWSDGNRTRAATLSPFSFAFNVSRYINCAVKVSEMIFDFYLYDSNRFLVFLSFFARLLLGRLVTLARNCCQVSTADTSDSHCVGSSSVKVINATTMKNIIFQFSCFTVFFDESDREPKCTNS